MPNKTDLHEQIEQLTKERDELQASEDKLEALPTPTISVSLIHSALENMINQVWTIGKLNRYEIHEWASKLAQEIMIDQAKGTRIEVDTLFIEPADLRIEYPTGDQDG